MFFADLVKKKSSFFSKDQVFSFMRLAPGTNEHLLAKMILMCGYFGALRCDDLVKLTWEMLEFDEGVGVWVDLQMSRKTGVLQDGHKFLMQACESDENICAIAVTREYRKATGHCSGRLFCGIRKNSFTSIPMGKNTIRAIPKKIAQTLNLNDPERFTGQCFRRTSATSAVDSGISLQNLKRHGSWKSSSVAEGYVGNSKRVRREIASLLADKTPKTQTQTASVPKQDGKMNFNFSHCQTVNFFCPQPQPNFELPPFPLSLPPLNFSENCTNPCDKFE
jgi:integrase